MCCVHRVSGAVKSSIQGTWSTVFQDIDLLTFGNTNEDLKKYVREMLRVGC